MSALGNAPSASDLARVALSVSATSTTRFRGPRSTSGSHLTGSCLDAIVHRSSKETLFIFQQPTKFSIRRDETKANRGEIAAALEHLPENSHNEHNAKGLRLDLLIKSQGTL